MLLTDGEVREVSQKCEMILTRRARDGAERPVATNWFLRALAVKCGRFDLVRYTSNYVQACLLDRNHKKQDKPLQRSGLIRVEFPILWRGGQSNLVRKVQADVASQADNVYFFEEINSTG